MNPVPRKPVLPAMPADEDAERMLAFKAGAVSAFTELVERHRDSVVTYFFLMGRDRDFAEDLAQELFAKLYRHRHEYEARAAFRTYLFSLARNLWIDAFRSRRRTAHHLSLDARVDGDDRSWSELLASPAAPPEEGAARAELQSQIMDAVARLPAEMREVFILGAMQDRDYADVARTLNIPVGTVKSRMFHAVRRLRSSLKPAEPAHASKGNARHDA